MCGRRWAGTLLRVNPPTSQEEPMDRFTTQGTIVTGIDPNHNETLLPRR